MSDKIQHFLLVFDHEEGRLIGEQAFGEDSDAAVAAYAATEQEYLGGGRLKSC